MRSKVEMYLYRSWAYLGIDNQGVKGSSNGNLEYYGRYLALRPLTRNTMLFLGLYHKKPR